MISEQNSAAPRILLIGGAIRSGTTVIHRALCTARNSNPYISESWFLHDVMRLCRWNLERYDVRLADQFGDRASFLDLIRLNFEHYFNLVSARYDNPQVLILKHPELIQHFADIGRMFPSILFLAIIRDPRDAIASMKAAREKHEREGVKTFLTRLGNIARMCAHYMSYYSPVIENLPALKQSLVFVRYEDVMLDPKQTISDIGAFCGADYDFDTVGRFEEQRSASTNFDKELRLADPLSAAFWSDLYRKDLSPERIGRFRENLSAGEIQEIEQRLLPIGKRFGYWG